MSAAGKTWPVWVAGLLPVLGVNAAFMINVSQGLDGCFPYLEGCHSVSRAVRSGPGLWLFKILALPCAAAMGATWLEVGNWLRRCALGSRRHRRAIVWLGMTGAAFFLVYAVWLGTEGDVYRWLRRYGVVFYFAGTGLAQLLLVSLLWRGGEGRVGASEPSAARGLTVLVAVAWALGVASALKRRIIQDPDFLDRVENALEWDFSLALSVAFLGLVPLLRRVKKDAVNPSMKV